MYNIINLLLVEDNKIDRQIYKKMFEDSPGLQIIEAVDGADAVKKAGVSKPDIVIMDYRMPKLNGLEASKQLIMMYPDVIILIVTAESSETLRIEASEIGAVSFMNKPVHSKLLCNTVLNFAEIIRLRESAKSMMAQASLQAAKQKPKEEPKLIHKVEVPEESCCTEVFCNESSSDINFDGDFCNTGLNSVANKLLGSEPGNKSAVQFLSELESNMIENLNTFTEASDDMVFLCSSIAQMKNIDSLDKLLNSMRVVSRELNFLKEFPNISYALNFLHDLMETLNYDNMTEAAFGKFCVYLSDFGDMYYDWYKSVFIDKTSAAIHESDTLILSFGLQAESIFHDVHVQGEQDESTADEGGSIEFF